MSKSMHPLWKPLLGLFACVALAACDVPAGNGLYVTQPTARAGTTLTSAKSLGEIAKTLRARGYRVSTRGGTLRVSTRSGALVDCGSFRQVFRGQTARFPGDAPKAILLSVNGPSNPTRRNVSVRSDAWISAGETPGRYNIRERHEVSVSYRQLATGKSSRETRRFDGSSAASFSDKTVCRSAGALTRI